MTDELEVIAGLEPEQIVERVKAIQLELEYWRQILDDATVINDALRDCTDSILEAATWSAVLAPVIEPRGVEPVEQIVAAQRSALGSVKVISERLNGLLELADGRAKALEPVGDALLRAAGIEPDVEPEGEQS